MESHREQPYPVQLPFSRVFLSWGSVTAAISAIPILFFVNSRSVFSLLAMAVFYGATVGLSGAWILTTKRPRELRSRRRFGKILGLFLPILLFLVVPLLLRLMPFFVFFALLLSPLTLLLIAGSILGGDWAAQRMEGTPLPNFGQRVESFFRRG